MPGLVMSPARKNENLSHRPAYYRSLQTRVQALMPGPRLLSRGTLRTGLTGLTGAGVSSAFLEAATLDY